MYKKKILFIFLWLVWLAMIFYLSSIPDLSSGLPTWQDFVLRKLAHMGEYAILFLLSAKVFSGVNVCGTGNKICGNTPWHIMVFSGSFSFLYAMSDEIHQMFVPGRAGTVQDVFIDTVGMVIGIIFWKKFFSK